MNTINGKQLKEVFLSGVNGIRNDSNRIDALNVFPVPDGDTGSNMSASAKYAADELIKINSNSVAVISAKFARGMLLGARGNSGVILSQIFKGFSVALNNKTEANGFDIANAFKEASIYAYKSVMTPIEGTILTVIRETSEELENQVTPSMSINDVFAIAVREAKKSVENTPNLLPVLKEVGVVDSGGEGLFQFLQAMFNHLEGKPTAFVAPSEDGEIFLAEETYEGEFGYCTEFIVTLKAPRHFKKDKFAGGLARLGKSAVVVVDEEILKVHIHTVKPGIVFNFAQKFGEFLKIKVENMNEQASENKASTINSKVQKNKPTNVAVISCNVGQGIINDMKEYGAHFIIEGGQTMNPSAADIIAAIETVDSDNVIILPNNSNIILAAQQATQTITNKKVIVLATKTQMQGLSAIMNFDPDGTLEDNKKEMTEVISEVGTVQVTKASRTTTIEGVKVVEDEYLSISNRKILGSFSTPAEAAIKALKPLINEESEVITIYYGDDSTLAGATEISSYLDNNFDLEVEIKSGDQPIYNYLISIE